MPNSELTRRKLLTGLAAAGGAGAGVGTGTSALLTGEVDGFGGTLAVGGLDLNLECKSENCEIGDQGGPSVDTTIRTMGGSHKEMAGGSTKFTLKLDGNPGYVWLRMDCLDLEESELDGELELTILFEGQKLAKFGMNDIPGKVLRGIQLSPQEEGVKHLESGEEYVFELTWEYDRQGARGYGDFGVSTFGGWPKWKENEDDEDGGDDSEARRLELPLNFKAEQRRNNTPTNPFENVGPCLDDDNHDEGDGEKTICFSVPPGQIGNSNSQSGPLEIQFEQPPVTISFDASESEKWTKIEEDSVTIEGSNFEICDVEVKEEPGSGCRNIQGPSNGGGPPLGVYVTLCEDEIEEEQTDDD